MENNLVSSIPTTKRGRRLCEKKAPKVVENVKSAMFIMTNTTNKIISDVMHDMYSLKKPNTVWYKRKDSNRILPFEDPTSIEYFSNRSDCSLFMLGSHNKKRPNNLVIGRLFDYQILDMIEFGVFEYKSIKDFGASTSIINSVASKPVFVLIGSAFSTEELYKTIANLFVDFFRGRVVDNLSPLGLDHVIGLSVCNGVIHFSHYAIQMDRQATETPKVSLIEVGPSMDLVIRRSRLATEDLLEESLKIPKEMLVRKKKNRSYDELRSEHGRIHIPDQNIDSIVTKKPRGLKRKHLNTEIEQPHAKKIKK